MKILKPILYCLLWAILAIVAMYFMNNKKEKQEVIIDKDVPTVELKISPTNVSVWDIVTYTVISSVESDNEAFVNDRIFYYDFDWDSIWDLSWKNDTETYAFLKSYENWVVPRALVEFRWKANTSDWEMIFVKPNNLKSNESEDSIYTDSSAWMNEYEKNREEIYALLPSWYNIMSIVESMFNDFDKNHYWYTKKEKTLELEKIRNMIIEDWKKNKWLDSSDEDIFTPYFCNIFDYYDIYDITDFTDKC